MDELVITQLLTDYGKPIGMLLVFSVVMAITFVLTQEGDETN